MCTQPAETVVQTIQSEGSVNNDICTLQERTDSHNPQDPSKAADASSPLQPASNDMSVQFAEKLIQLPYENGFHTVLQRPSDVSIDTSSQ